MNVDLNNLFRVSKRQVEMCLMWEGRDFWLVPSNCEPHYAMLTDGGSKPRSHVPPHFVKVCAADEITSAAKLLNDLMKSRGWTEGEFPTEYRAPHVANVGKWATVVSCAFAKSAGEFRTQHCHGALGREVHYYFEHPSAVDLTPLNMGIDFVREREGWHTKPDGTLVVPFFNAFHPPGLKRPAIGLLTSLPNWKVKAPASLMSRVTRIPSINTYGTGPRRVEQIAYRLSDIEVLWGFLGLPWSLYFKPLHSRHTPKGYVREAFKQSATGDQDGTPGLD